MMKNTGEVVLGSASRPAASRVSLWPACAASGERAHQFPPG